MRPKFYGSNEEEHLSCPPEGPFRMQLSREVAGRTEGPKIILYRGSK